ncbi:MAG: hypothetical protein LJE84_10035 [Gammaproteobacteria bacterium]|nr:hypothetical protein [Gammaproteobacteria bacterium]
MRYPKSLLAAFALAALAGCAGLDTRISHNQAFFDSLPVERQITIRSGRIEQGFSKNEVFLAWGRPQRVREGDDPEGAHETWIYTTVQVDTHFHYGWGGYHFRHGFYDDLYPHFTYRPAVERYVVFREDRVVRWESRDFPYAGPIPPEGNPQAQ